MNSKTTQQTQWWLRLLTLVAALLAIVFFILTPWNIVPIPSHPKPAQSYREAVQLIEQLRQQEQQAMNPLCTLELMTHNKTTERAIILVHGYTSCPRQFHELGKRLYAEGYNVLIAPLPHHGLANRMTSEHGRLKAEELARYADATVDIAQGLGDKVFMIGLSAGGVTTAWAAQHRHDLNGAVIIAPAFGFKKIPAPLTGAAMNLYGLAPDSFTWWDPTKREKAKPLYGYPAYSHHALTEILRLGFTIRADAQCDAAAAQKVIVVLNAFDDAVNNESAYSMINVWRQHNTKVRVIEFPAQVKLPHDMIDPSKPEQQTELVYPFLIKLLNN